MLKRQERIATQVNSRLRLDRWYWRLGYSRRDVERIRGAERVYDDYRREAAEADQPATRAKYEGLASRQAEEVRRLRLRPPDRGRWTGRMCASVMPTLVVDALGGGLWGLPLSLAVALAVFPSAFRRR